jgi:DNA-binding MurR/RpiR family transcriptional regulator
LKQQEQMSAGEKSIANYIISLKHGLDKYSTRNLADATYTSPATVIRLCKKMGFSGFDDFKEQYRLEKEYLEQDFGEIDVNFPFQKDDTISKSARKMCRLYDQIVQDTLSIMRYDMLVKAVTILKCCSTIYIFSAGTALNIAETFREKMMKIGRNVQITNNLNYQLYSAECLQKGDCALIISYSGETDKMLQIAGLCKEKEIPVIAMTSFGENTLSQMATCKLYLSTRESLFYNIGDFSSHISVTLLLDILYSAYFLQDYDKNYAKKLELVKKREHLRHSTNPYLSGEKA